MSHKVNFHVRCYIFTFSCIILACAIQYIFKKSLQKENKAEKNLGKTMSSYFVESQDFVVAGCSAQVSWVYTGKTYNFCVFFCACHGP